MLSLSNRNKIYISNYLSPLVSLKKVLQFLIQRSYIYFIKYILSFVYYCVIVLFVNLMSLYYSVIQSNTNIGATVKVFVDVINICNQLTL